MAIKVYLAKAYDHIEWSFIHKVLKAFLFSQMMIDLIMSCVSTTRISILFNGAKWTRLVLQEESVKGTSSPHIFSYYVWNTLVSLFKENALLKSGPH